MLTIRVSVSTNQRKGVDYKLLQSTPFNFWRRNMNYNVIIIGAGPGGIFSAYELASKSPDKKIAVFEAGHPLNKRRCPTPLPAASTLQEA